MERKQGIFKSFKDDVVGGLSPARYRRARSQSPLPSPLRRSRGSSVGPADTHTKGSGLSWPGFEALSPFKGGPLPKSERRGSRHSPAPSVSTVGPDYFRSDQRLLLGVIGAPLGPSPSLAIKDNSIESSTAKYILHQYIAASGGQKMESTVENAYASGSVKMMTSCIETDTKVLKSTNSAKEAESGSFELWQMNPDMWYVELALGDSKVQAGCNGRLVWRQTPWLLGTHAVKGPGRPLRRALQGLDPRTTARMFGRARYTGEKNINDEACFTLEICADSQTLEATSDKQTKATEHTLVGWFSQRTGLLVGLKDSHMKLIRTEEGGSVYWKTTIESLLEDYTPVEGIMIAHSGRSEVTLARGAGESCTTTRIEETWTVREVAFNVPGLSMDSFTPPAELEACDRPREDRLKRVNRRLEGRGGAALW
ncbi:hypothetical protein SASPL_137160 [Salvia splendens]|uniref:Uncharacterized protein n=1 Tax=Salvia splendens TaxID=180675 RepID=A0A8X8ZDT6_SALSN|nr:uncharacterized protein LOC121765643 [Salvia splendens]KAG6400334.1 hypothetical protein SASPL_137160 [Salvia splendens]